MTNSDIKPNRDRLWVLIKSNIIGDNDINNYDDNTVVVELNDKSRLDIHFTHDKINGLVYVYTIGIMDTPVTMEDKHTKVEFLLVLDINFLGIKDLAEIGSNEKYHWSMHYLYNMCKNIVDNNETTDYYEINNIPREFWNRTNYRASVISPINKNRITYMLNDRTVEILPIIMLKNDEVKRCKNKLDTILQLEAIMKAYGSITYADRDNISGGYDCSVLELLSNIM